MVFITLSWDEEFTATIVVSLERATLAADEIITLSHWAAYTPVTAQGDGFYASYQYISAHEDGEGETVYNVHGLTYVPRNSLRKLVLGHEQSWPDCVIAQLPARIIRT